MEVYKGETREIIRRFRNRDLDYPGCIAALDAALAGLIPSLACEQLGELRVILLANDEEVHKELAGRSGQTPGVGGDGAAQNHQRKRDQGTTHPRFTY